VSKIELLLLIVFLLLLILLFKYLQTKRQIRNLSKQIAELVNGKSEKMLDISLIDKDLEQLAGILNQYNDNQRQLIASTLRHENYLKESIANISHDLRTPLTVILGHLQLLRKETLTDKQEQRIETIFHKAERMKEKLTHITDNEFYVVDSLTHSIPYLVPRASALLDTIGSNFLDSLAAKGLNPNQVIVTSVLRTQSDVKRLRRRNGNASANSAHCFGATFDVSWKRFKKVEDEDGRPLQDVGSDTLKLVLSEVLRDLRQAEKCYIKYELKQGCFHITAR